MTPYANIEDNCMHHYFCRCESGRGLSKEVRDARDGNSDNVPAPKSTLLSSSAPKSSLDITLWTSSSESMGLSDPNVCGVAGNAASTSVCFVLLAFLTGRDSCEVFVGVVVLSS